MLSHLNLKVDAKALASVIRLAGHSASWDKRPAVVDQLMRNSRTFRELPKAGLRISEHENAREV